MVEDSRDENALGYPDAVKSVENGESPSVAVVKAVVEETGRPIADLEPLEQTVDTDALDSLFAGQRNGEGRNGEFAFDYEGFHVTVLYDDGADVLLERRA